MLLTIQHLFRVRERFAITTASTTVVVGVLVLVGWVVDNPILKSVVPGFATMKANAALCFVLLGIGLVTCQQSHASRWRLHGQVCLALVLLITALTLLEITLRTDFGIDQLLFADPEPATAGRMAPITAVICVLLSGSLLLVATPRVLLFAQILSSIALILATLCSISYLYAMDATAAVPFGAVPLHTALTLTLLSAATFVTLLSPHQIAVVSGDSMGSMLARRLLPLAVVLPLFVGWIGVVGLSAGWFGLDSNMAVITVARILCLVSIVMWMAVKVSRLEAEREKSNAALKASEEELRRLNADLERQVHERTSALQQSGQRFRAIFNTQFQFIGVMSTEGILLEANTAALAAAGVSSDEVVGKFIWDTAWWRHDPRQRMRLQDAVRRAAAGEHIRFEASHVAPDGSMIWVDFSLTPFRDGNGHVIMLIPEEHDITERKKAEQDLRLQEERFRSAFEFGPIGIALVAREGRWLRVNRSLCEMLGYSEEEMLETDFQSLTHPDDINIGMEYVDQTRRGEINSFQVEKRYLHKLGYAVPVTLAVSSVKDATGYPVYFVAQIQDIMERKLAEKEMAARDALLRQFIKHSPAAIVMMDRDLRYVQASDRWLADYNLTGREVMGVHHYELFPDIPERWKLVHQRVLAGAVERSDEDPFEREDGSVMWLQWECRPWHRGDGAVGGLIMFTQIITERKHAEEHVKSSLREKEVLLKEIHHRVKNNLQIVSTLLDLQSEHTSNPQALEMFQESRGRVKSMALIHERLYRSQDMARVNFSDYVRQLVDDLYQSYKISDDEISLDLDVNILPLSIDIAIPCGLLLNELITNCFKHAFVGRERGNIRVALHGEGEDGVVMTVADDGVGLPVGMDLYHTASFGMQLVNTLVEQLNGDITLTGYQGAAFTIRFRHSKK